MQNNVIVCLCVGDAYSDEYVYMLRNMTSRFCSVPHDFICVSDREIKGVHTITIDSTKYPPLWYKLQILDMPEIHQYQHKVFFDLDVVIHGSIDWCFDFQPGGLGVIRSVWKPNDISDIPGNTGINSSIMIWNEARYVWDLFQCDVERFTRKYKGIDRFIWNEPIRWVSLPPDQVYSFREGATLVDRQAGLFRPERSVCIFNQLPKPHQVRDVEPVKSYWK